MKLIFGLAILSLFILLSVPVLAESNATSSSRNKDLKTVKVEKLEKTDLKEREATESVEIRIGKLEAGKKLLVVRIRKSVIERYGVYEKLIERSGNLLTKLQERIDKAQKSGLNTKVVDGYMNDAKIKLADAQANLNSIKSLKDTAIDKTTFQDIQKKFIVIHRDLNAIRLDGAKVISELKRYNTENEKLTPKPTKVKSATTSAEKS